MMSDQNYMAFAITSTLVAKLRPQNMSNVSIKMVEEYLQLGTVLRTTQLQLLNISLILLAAEPGKLIGDHDVQLCSTLNNLLALAGGDVVGNFRTVRPVVLQKIGCKQRGRLKDHMQVSISTAHLHNESLITKGQRHFRVTEIAFSLALVMTTGTMSFLLDYHPPRTQEHILPFRIEVSYVVAKLSGMILK